MFGPLHSHFGRHRLAQLAMLLLLPASAACAEIVACEIPLIQVDTDDPVLRARVCDVATDALPALGACHLTLKQPVVFTFETEISTMAASCLGLYHRETGQVSLLTPGAFSQVHAQSDFCDMITAEAHFDTIVVHELTHALLDQSPCSDTLCRVDNEYIAYAIQLEAMPKSTRDLFLARYGPRSPDQADRVNSFFLDAAPIAFAAASWLHFTSPGNGCDLVGRILSGEFTFYREPW